MFAGDRVFKADDVRSALEAAQTPGNTTRPTGAGWVALPGNAFGQYLASFSERRGTGELLGRGLKNIAYGLGTLPGTAATLAGFEETGAALRAPVESLLGDSENEQLRSALIAENSSLWEQIVDGSIESIPLLVGSLAGGMGAASLASRAGMATQGVTRAATAGAAGANFPIHLAGMYDAAVRNQQDLSDPLVKVGVLGGALANSYLDTFGIESRLLSPVVKAAAENAAKGVVRRRLTSGVATGFAEAGTEVTQTFLESVLFDPVVHDNLSPQDWKVLAPYIAEQYGEQMLVAAGAGALLGGGVGVVAPQGAFARGAPKPPVPTDKPKDLNITATEQAAEKEAPLELSGPQLSPDMRPEALEAAALERGWQNLPDQFGNAPLRGQLSPEEEALAAGWTRETAPLGERQGPVAPVSLIGQGRTDLAPALGAQRLRARPSAAAALPPEAAPLIAEQRTDLPVGAQRLRVRPSERVEAYAPPAAGNTALGEQLLRAMAQRQQAAQPQMNEVAPVAEAPVAEQPAATGEVTPREYDDAYATWELVRAEQPNPDVLPALARLRKDAQREWIDAVRSGRYLLPDGTPDLDLFQELTGRKQSKMAPLVETGVTRTETGAAPVGAELLRRQTEAADARTALERTTATGAARLQNLAGRLEQAKPAAAAPKPKPLNKKQRAVANRFLALEPEQQQAVIAELGGNEQAAMSLLRSDPDVFNAAIDRVSTPPETTPPGGGTKKSTIQRKPAAAPKKDALRTKKPAEPKAPESKAAPEPEAAPEPKVQAPKVTLAESVDALDDTQLTALQAALPNLDLDEAIKSRPDTVEAALNKVLGVSMKTPTARVSAEVVAERLAEKTGAPKDAVELSDLIRDYNSGAAMKPGFTAKFKELVAAVRKSNPDAPLGLNKLLDYAKPDGAPNTLAYPNGKKQIVPVGTTLENPGRNMLADFNTIDGVVDTSGKPVLPMAAGRVELLVRSYVKKLSRPPTITVVRNQADLKAKNPALYKRASAARKQGDFDAANALGYSFGDGEIIIFSDRIGSEQQLNFVLAHESLGHYGLRAIMPADKFNATMEAVYKSDPIVAATVDMAVEVRGMSRAEATEEYLADYAAVLDMSLLRRVAAAMKNALNAVGFKFSDDMVRHLLRMSRRYVRNGKRDSLFSTSDIFRDINTIESGVDQLGTGRFKEGFKSDNLRTDALSHDVYGAVPRSMEDLNSALKDVGERLSTRTETTINKFFSLTKFRAMENPGLAKLVRILEAGAEIATSVRNRADATLSEALNREVRFLGIKVMGDITETEQQAASYLMYTQQDNVRGKVDEKVEATMKKLREAKKPTRMYSIVGDNIVPNDAAIEAYSKAGRLELAEAKAILAKDKRYKDIAAALTTDHPAWKAYVAGRDAFTEAELQFVESQYKALLADRDNGQLALLDMLPDPGPGKDKELTAGEKEMFNTWTELYFSLYSKDAVSIEDNLIVSEGGAAEAAKFNRAVNEALIAKGFDTKKEEAIRDFFKGKQADDFIAQVVAFRKRISLTESNKFVVQEAVSAFGAREMSYTSAETSARKMLVQGYTGIVRKQTGVQLRVNAFDAKTGEWVQMEDGYKGLAVYRTAGTMEEGTVLANKMNAQFADSSKSEFGDVSTVDVDGVPTRVYKIKARKSGDVDFKEYSVILRTEVSAAVTDVSTPLNLNLNEFLRGLQQYGLNVHPSKLEQIVTDMTSQDNRARKRLEQTGNPGYQVEGGVTALEAIAQHIDTRASLIAKIEMRPQIDRLMNTKLRESQRLWFGDKDKLKALKDAYDAAVSSGANEDAVYLAKADYTDYAAKMKNTITTKNGMEVNLGNKYLSEAHSLMSFVNANRDVNESDWGSGPVASWMRRWISSVQLGGSLAQPIMNNIGPLTNFIPWLMSYNEKTGFGGGAGFTNAYAQYFRALSDVGGAGGVSFSKRALEMHTAEYWDQVATGMREHAGVSKAEAEFIADQTRSGVLTPAQANSLLGTSRNYTTNPAIRQALDKWMFFYVSSEQATRRAAALAAFRVEMDRQLSAKGVTLDKLSLADYKKFHARATTFATDGVRFTLGEYGVTNRPAAWRSGFQSFLYMYRVWPTTSIQTLSRLDNVGKAAFLLPLLAMSGLGGLPFAEDVEDLIDTLLQRTGASVGSVRLEMARLIDEVLPGSSAYILNGPMSKFIGLDTAGRFGMGDFIPGTAGLLPGQELSETLKDVIGPAWGFIEGTLMGGSQLAAAPFSDTATVVDAMRQGPVTLLRALGDTMAYSSSGAVIDKRGYVIEPDVTTAMLAIRVLGFSPAPVAAQYEVIRLAKRETNYQKQVVAKFRTGLLKAEMSGDSVTAASIRRSVREWNAANKGTLLEIRDFDKNYARLKKQAMMPAQQRFLKSAGKANQDAIDFIDQLVSYD
jgi:hypothetical protein